MERGTTLRGAGSANGNRSARFRSRRIGVSLVTLIRSRHGRQLTTRKIPKCPRKQAIGRARKGVRAGHDAATVRRRDVGRAGRCRSLRWWRSGEGDAAGGSVEHGSALSGGGPRKRRRFRCRAAARRPRAWQPGATGAPVERRSAGATGGDTSSGGNAGATGGASRAVAVQARAAAAQARVAAVQLQRRSRDRRDSRRRRKRRHEHGRRKQASDRVILGDTGIEVSRLAMGSGTVVRAVARSRRGSVSPSSPSCGLRLRTGINFFETADAYGRTRTLPKPSSGGPETFVF